MAKILIVDDDAALADMMGAWLRNARYVVDVLYDGGDAQQLIDMYNYDLLILDWSCPARTASLSVQPIVQAE
jgi:DNA-binding response OmpR family regulator